MMSRDGKKAAENIIKEAQDKAEGIIAEAKRQAEDLVNKAKQQIVAFASKPAAPSTEKSVEGKKTYTLNDGTSNTVVIHCSDSRFQEAFRHFIENELGLKSYNPFVVPGASQLLALYDTVPKFSSALMRYLQFMVKHRAIKNMVIIMHEDCAWYQHFVPKFLQIKGTQKDQQVNDMLKAKKLLQEEFPGVGIKLYYTAIAPEKKVEFSEIH